MRIRNRDSDRQSKRLELENKTFKLSFCAGCVTDRFMEHIASSAEQLPHFADNRVLEDY